MTINLASLRNFAAASFFCMPVCAFAQSTASPQAPQTPPVDHYKETVSIGVLAAYTPEYAGAKNYRLLPTPVGGGSIGHYTFALQNNQLSIQLIRNQPGPVWGLQAGPLVHINFDRAYNSLISDARVRSLGALGAAVELGGFVGIAKTGVITNPYDNISMSVSYRHDISGVHNGGIIQPNITYSTPLSQKVGVSFSGTAEFVSRNYATTYYGVDQSQSKLSGLSTFDAHAGIKDWNTGLQLQYALTGNLQHGWSAMVGASYGRMEGSVAQSPLVRQTGAVGQWLETAGVAYIF